MGPYDFGGLADNISQDRLTAVVGPAGPQKGVRSAPPGSDEAQGAPHFNVPGVAHFS
jgi:hypothetical protein